MSEVTQLEGGQLIIYNSLIVSTEMVTMLPKVINLKFLKLGQKKGFSFWDAKHNVLFHSVDPAQTYK